MDYPYENLGPESFQLFCQALLAKEYPGMQCFPVAQPDGGRDAAQINYRYDGRKELVIFQVKYVRQPFGVQDPHRWVLDMLESEAPKVVKLIPRGAVRYVLITNVPATAHLDSGSVDKADLILGSNIQIPCSCWWRNDLSRRLDSAWDVKWAYPVLMTGPDLIRSFIEGGLSDSKDRRASAIRAFVSFQFSVEQEVKFRQVDLQNKLLDLFVDLPIGPGLGARWSDPRRYLWEDDFPYEVSSVESDSDSEEYEWIDNSRPPFIRRVSRRVGAASELLSRYYAKNHPFVVLEGAPGQGKSTITQYLCQVHRMRILGRADDLALVPEDHRNSPLRLPIKVDLRDFATWSLRRNPFSAESEEIPLGQWDRSLEFFLAALIRSQSGGVSFDVADLHAVVRISAVLLVLDGLDEVADIKRRGDVIAEITKGVDRLSSIAASLQVVVTSRPAAYENCPGLPDTIFHYFSLGSVNKKLIDEYSAKWLRARRLHDRESAEVKRIMRDRLDQPHIRDLARNPMQLAILLSLIHTRGTSLPDKRTSLYDNYVELFFNREAEKTAIVRENRDLLIDIHRYLGWVLHTEAECSGREALGLPNGAIEESRLQALLVDYLKAEGRDPDLAEALFSGVVERVVALVSRVQGTYEFEVQPLREYFAARFLHETAPYSPVGAEKNGTRPDRFDAIARNFYWLNVTRFYAGCYSKGELTSLIDRLNELICDPEFRLLSHPRVLAATLLGDWVFTQHPKSVSEVVRLVLDGIGLRFLLASTSRRQSHSQPLSLPPACGKIELVEKCFSMLRDIPPADYALDVLDLLRANATREEIFPRWQAELAASVGGKRTAWFEYGLHLGCFSLLQSEDVAGLLSDEEIGPDRMGVLLKARRSDLLDADAESRRRIIGFLLSGRVSAGRDGRRVRLLEAFGQSIDPAVYAAAFQISGLYKMAAVAKKLRLPDGDEWRNLSGAAAATASSLGLKGCCEVLSTAASLMEESSEKWATELEPWDLLVGSLSRSFGTCWAAWHLANVGAGIKSTYATCTDSSSLFDEEKSIFRRARYARLRAGTPTWWEREFRSASSPEEVMVCCLIYFTWASSNTFSQTVLLADGLLSGISEENWLVLVNSVSQAVELTGMQGSSRRGFDLKQGDIPSPIVSPRTLTLLRLRSKGATSRWLYDVWRGFATGRSKAMLQVFQDDAIERLLSRKESVEENLEVLASAYANNVLSPPYAAIRFSRAKLMNSFSMELASCIADKADCYPGFLVAAAEARCREHAMSHVRPVAEVAKSEGWF